MILVADSGSTKCDWALVKNDGTVEKNIRTIGFNPYYINSAGIVQELRNNFVNQIKDYEVEEVYFYGAGCSDRVRCGVIEDAMLELFPNAFVRAEHDLLGAARAVCGVKPGIACILGTGSNTCVYDGNQVVDQVTNLGYLLGDEGSGSHLGKFLIQSYFYREMPDELISIFESLLPNGSREIINEIYNGKAPNVYLASFSTFYSENINHPFIQQLCRKSFGEFLDRHVLKYKNANLLPLNFVGSVAFHLKDILKEEVEKRNLIFGDVNRRPIENLVNYHIEVKQSV